MNVNEFIQSSIGWNKLVHPDIDMGTQKAIVEQERQEYNEAKKAGNEMEMDLEAADCIWTIAYLQKMANEDGKLYYSQVCHALVKEYAKAVSPEALQAVSTANWSKIKQGEQILSAQSLDSNRYKKVREEGKGEYRWLVGDDYKDPENPIIGKLLKPDGYMTAQSVYLKLKDEQ